jgi:hypothetical protein
MPSARLIRLLVMLYWLFGSLDVLTSTLFPGLLPEPLRAWQQAEPQNGFADMLVIAWMLILLVLLIAGSLGVYRLRNWGRWLFATANVVMFASYPLLDAMVYSWLGGLFADLALVITGAIVMASFMAPDAVITGDR